MAVIRPRHRVRRDANRFRPEQGALRVGFVPLIDAGPLVVAAELGYFADEGLNVALEKQIGWGNVRDRLTYGDLDASHAPLGMVPASIAGLANYHEPFTVVMQLGAGGNAITIAKGLLDGGAEVAPARWMKKVGRPLDLAYVFSVASHHYALRRLLDAAGLDAERDARLRVLPPAQMTALLGKGTIDGFCAGEPWNTLASLHGPGTIVCATTELMPDHPEKVLAVTRRWLAQNAPVAERLVRAALRGCDFCEDPRNRSRLTELLAAPQYLDVDEDVIARSLSIDEWLRPGVRRGRFRSFARANTVPRVEAVRWVVGEMVRWGQLAGPADVDEFARSCVSEAAYVDAVAQLKRPSLSDGHALETKGVLQ